MGRIRSLALCRRWAVLVCEQIDLSDLNWTRLSVLDCEQLPAGPGTGAPDRSQRPADDQDKAATGLLVVHLAASLADGDGCRDDDVSPHPAAAGPGRRPPTNRRARVVSAYLAPLVPVTVPRVRINMNVGLDVGPDSTLLREPCGGDLPTTRRSARTLKTSTDSSQRLSGKRETGPPQRGFANAHPESGWHRPTMWIPIVPVLESCAAAWAVRRRLLSELRGVDCRHVRSHAVETLFRAVAIVNDDAGHRSPQRKFRAAFSIHDRSRHALAHARSSRVRALQEIPGKEIVVFVER
jgi:hypothetical protein